MNGKLYKICTNCTYFCREKEKDNFCPLCGEKLITQCEKCGEKIDNPYAEYCKSCGSRYRKKNRDNNTITF